MLECKEHKNAEYAYLRLQFVVSKTENYNKTISIKTLFILLFMWAGKTVSNVIRSTLTHLKIIISIQKNEILFFPAAYVGRKYGLKSNKITITIIENHNIINSIEKWNLIFSCCLCGQEKLALKVIKSTFLQLTIQNNYFYRKTKYDFFLLLMWAGKLALRAIKSTFWQLKITT